MEGDANIVWSMNGWATNNKVDAIHISALNVWFADLPTEKCPDGSMVEFTFFWKKDQRWEGENHRIAVSEKTMANK